MDAAGWMELFGNLVYVFIAITVLGFGLSVFFYFFFDIRNVRALMTGKAKRQTIERMEEQNRKTGSLKTVTGGIRDTSVPVIQNPASENTVQVYAPRVLSPTVEMGYQQTQETEILVSMDTAVLAPEDTMVLNQPERGETQVLSRADLRPASGAVRTSAPGIRFDITESTLVIHTREII